MTQEFASIAGPPFHSFLESYGLKCVSATETFVRWESPTIFLTCNYDFGRSFEMSVEIGQKKGGPERPFNYGEFVRSQAVPKADWPSGYTALTPDAVKTLATKLARLLSDYGQPLLTNQSGAWSRLTDLRERECREFALQQELRYARQDAEEAWKAKDFHRFILRLSRFQDVLQPSDLAKLKYAEAQATNGSEYGK